MVACYQLERGHRSGAISSRVTKKKQTKCVEGGRKLSLAGRKDAEGPRIFTLGHQWLQPTDKEGSAVHLLSQEVKAEGEKRKEKKERKEIGIKTEIICDSCGISYQNAMHERAS